MQVVVPVTVAAGIKTLGSEERHDVIAWLDHLKNWENDERVQKLSKLTAYKDTYVLNASDDLRIFFRLDAGKSRIVLMDVAKPSRFETAGMSSE